MLEIGSLVDGKYRILSKCGQGGMSVVYMARNERANKTWAIKEVRKDGTQDFEVVKQGLIVETDMLKRLNHPHLPSIIDVIDGEGSFLIVMDFIEGKTLKDVLAEYGAQPQESVIDWAKQLCDVLGYLHSRQPAIIYRDMKPSNVMLKPDGNIVLFDFGTAREYKAQSLEDTTCLGTKGYAAPEQYGGHGQTDARTDIYCLGATMYHLLTAHNPGEPPYEMYPIRQWNPSLSAGLEAIILKCTQKNPADRYQSCAELLYDLDHYWESDVKYRKQQVSKFRKFLIPATASLIFGIGAICFNRLEVGTTKSTYEAYITAANNSAIKADKVENYRKAINLDPSQSQAYLELLENAYLSDDVLTMEERDELRQILIDYGSSGKTNEIVFKTNKEGYERFAYRMGIAYYYKYGAIDENGENQKIGDKTNAKSYFQVASESTYLTESQRERAKMLYTISNYFDKLGKSDDTGDTAVSYGDYWNDLINLTSGNLVEVDNANTALIMYNDVVAQIVSRTNELKNGHVTKEQMEAQLVNIEQHLESDFKNINESSRESVESKIAELKENIAIARRQMDSTFGLDK